MEFEDQESNNFYSNHEVHNDFLAKQWLAKVDSFQEPGRTCIDIT